MMTLVCAILMVVAPPPENVNISNKTLFMVTAFFDCLNFIAFRLAFL